MKITVSRRVGSQWKDIDHTISPDANGNFVRLLAPGRYRITAACTMSSICSPHTEEINIPANQASPVSRIFDMSHP